MYLPSGLSEIPSRQENSSSYTQSNVPFTIVLLPSWVNCTTFRRKHTHIDIIPTDISHTCTIGREIWQTSDCSLATVLLIASTCLFPCSIPNSLRAYHTSRHAVYWYIPEPAYGGVKTKLRTDNVSEVPGFTNMEAGISTSRLFLPGVYRNDIVSPAGFFSFFE